MALEITVGPPVLTINQSATFMVTDHGGEIDPRRAQGVFSDDTRFVSSYRLRVNGHEWQRLSSAVVSHDRVKLFLVNPPIPAAQAVAGLVANTIGLEIDRFVESGIAERFGITSYASGPVSFVFEVELASDFSDLFEVRSGDLRVRENLVTLWDGAKGELTTTYEREDFFRRFVYQIVKADAEPRYANGRLRFPVRLAHGETWRAVCQMLFHKGRQARQPRHESAAATVTRPQDNQLQQRWLTGCSAIRTSAVDLRLTYEQSVRDMGALRLYERDLGPDVWVPAAGVPWFVTLFGRDSLIASLESLIVSARFAEGALRVLAQYQARERDDWRDEQPGKIMHEIRCGELAHFHEIPQTPYYGTWDATSLYLIALHQAWRWLGDRKLIEDLKDTAEGCLRWIDEHGDLDGDGFQEYRTYSPSGFEDMAWKDSGHGVVYPDGSEVKQPKALCELQGYVYAAKRGMAEVHAALGDDKRAHELEEQASLLKSRFEDAFWMEDEGTYAYALDPEKRQVKTVVSNPGHCLWSGIADESHAGKVARRLLADDMWTGLGVRTLSSRNPAYNPFSYQRGAVWPHDNAILAAGMKRYGLHAQANQLVRGILDASSMFQSRRLPEVFSGLDRRSTVFPVQYRGANTPQAWAAGSVFLLLQAMLGLEADVPNGRLWVTPTLPDWVPDLEMMSLEAGSTRLHLRFWREGERTRFQVVDERGPHLDVAEKPTGRATDPASQSRDPT